MAVGRTPESQLYRKGQEGEVVDFVSRGSTDSPMAIVCLTPGSRLAYFQNELALVEEPKDVEQKIAELLTDIALRIGTELSKIQDAKPLLTETTARNTLDLAFDKLHNAHCLVFKALRQEKAT